MKNKTNGIMDSLLNKLLLGYLIIYVVNIGISVYGLYVNSINVLYYFFIPAIIITIIYNLYFWNFIKKKRYPHELLLLPAFGLLVPAIIVFLYVFVVLIGDQQLHEIKLTIFEVTIYSIIIFYSIMKLHRNLVCPIDGIKFGKK